MNSYGSTAVSGISYTTCAIGFVVCEFVKDEDGEITVSEETTATMPMVVMYPTALGSRSVNEIVSMISQKLRTFSGTKYGLSADAENATIKYYYRPVADFAGSYVSLENNSYPIV